MSLKELQEKVRYLRKIGVNTTELAAEIHERLNFSFSIIAFIILGFSVSLMVKHREKSINFGIAFLIAGIYYLLFILGEALIEYHVLTASLGMWLPNVVITVIGGFLLYKNAHFR
jgi:lipopolysaccharide export LptBFGC system permease protein LptF